MIRIERERDARPVLSLQLLEIHHRRSAQHLAVRIEARTVTRTVPAFLRRVPIHEAAQMRAHGRAFVHRSSVVLVRRNLM